MAYLMKDDANWTGGNCTQCGKPAVAHQLGFNERGVLGEPVAQDPQAPVIERFGHADGSECTHVLHKHDWSIREQDGVMKCECGATQKLGLS